MPEFQDRVIEAAVRPFSDNAETRHSAADFLEKRVTDDAAAASSMLERWDEVDARKRKPVWHIGLWGVVALVSAGVAVSGFDEISRLVPWVRWVAGGSMFAPMPTDPIPLVASKLSDADKLLLFGDLSMESKSEHKEALWRSEPENPAYFAEFAGAFISDYEKLPPDFLETARRIDPENAWFTYLAAAVEAGDSVKSRSRKSKQVAGKTVYDGPKSWEILDQARLDRAMKLVADARKQPKFTDYSAEMLRKRIHLLPEGTFMEQLESGACLAGTTTFSSLRLLRLAKAIATTACRSGEVGDISGFQEISSDGDRFIRGTCSDENGTLLDEMAKSLFISILAESFDSAAETLGLESDAAHWNPIANRMIGTKQQRDLRKFMVDGKAVEPGTVTGGIFGGSIELLAKRPEKQPPLTDADLKPMRLVDHELLSWVLSYILWAVIALCVCLVASYRFRVTTMSRGLARRMVDLLRPSDWGWILGVGVLLPFAYVMAVNRLTPLGGRALGVQGMALLMPAGHFLGLLLMWLTLPVQIVRWRLAKRAGGFGFPRPSRTGWLAVVCGAAFVPMIGWAAISNFDGPWMEAMRMTERTPSETPWQFWAALPLAGVSVLWAIGLISLAMLGRADRHLYRATSSIVLVRAYAATLFVLALASVGFKATEQYWFKQDWMSKFDASGPGWNAYESKVAIQLRKELRETLEYER